MKQTFSNLDLDELFSGLLKKENPKSQIPNLKSRTPVHVVYGGANLFKAGTPAKLGTIALKSLESYAPNFVEFAQAMWLAGADNLPKYEDVRQDLEFALADNPEKVKVENYDAWFAWTIYQKTIDKLKREPIEDFRIDFEDGYGIRTDAEEDSHCLFASEQLAVSSQQSPVNSQQAAVITPFCGFRIKSFQAETRRRAVRTLDLFLTNLLKQTEGKLPENFVVTLPKVKYQEEVEILDKLLFDFEKQNNLRTGEIKIEILIETPESILNMQDLVLASNGRCIAAHFGAYDYTSGFGIVATHQHIRHEACNFARNMMQISLSPLGIRLSDSVTVEMPIPIYRGENLSIQQIAENKLAVKNAWRKHFNNITHSMINGFYQSWDLHPAQLVARYAAVYAFFLEARDEQAKRLRSFLDKATQAMTTGNLFDDLASAEGLLNFFVRGIGCGAFQKEEVLEETGLSRKELDSASFVKIMEKRFENS
jgi:hypothetical protein